uniref:Uncharacterized protein n=1 Tax=Avena sativa TaxID=4498 RepID=A0ACD5Z6Z5_AVESA
MARQCKFALPLMVAVLVLLAASGSARRLGRGGDCVGEATSGSAESPIMQFLQHIYLQELTGAGHSCDTYNPNNPACHHS